MKTEFATYTQAESGDFQVGQSFFIENTFWSVTATVIKVTDKAIEAKSEWNKAAWFPKSALMWRDGEKGETCTLAKWFRKDNRHSYFFGEAA